MGMIWIRGHEAASRLQKYITQEEEVLCGNRMEARPRIGLRYQAEIYGQLWVWDRGEAIKRPLAFSQNNSRSRSICGYYGICRSALQDMEVKQRAVMVFYWDEMGKRPSSCAINQKWIFPCMRTIHRSPKYCEESYMSLPRDKSSSIQTIKCSPMDHEASILFFSLLMYVSSVSRAQE